MIAKRRKRAAPRRRPAPILSRPRLVPVVDPDLEEVLAETLDGVETARPAAALPSVADLAAGDLDASWQGVESGEESPGGSTPTPDQDNVDQIGASLGVVEQDEKPLATTEKLEGRDRARWELDPASAEDLEERERAEARRARRRAP